MFEVASELAGQGRRYRLDEGFEVGLVGEGGRRAELVGHGVVVCSGFIGRKRDAQKQKAR